MLSSNYYTIDMILKYKFSLLSETLYYCSVIMFVVSHMDPFNLNPKHRHKLFTFA